MILLKALLVFLAVQSATAFRLRRQRNEHKCEEVRTDICLRGVHKGYNSTIFPNHLGHRSQDEALLAIAQFTPLIKVSCSKHLATFLCSLYIPLCTPGFSMLPCQELCEHARDGCAPIMNKFGFLWNFNCTKYPDGTKTKMCLGTDVKERAEKEESASKQTKPEGKEKIRPHWVSGKENEMLHLSCDSGKWISIRKVRTPSNAKCCPIASKTVINAMCSGNQVCDIKVSKSTLGGHCKSRVSKLSIKYKCQTQIKKAPCAD